MDKKKDFWLSITGLIVILVGAIVLLVIDYPAGLLLILPAAILTIIKLKSLKMKQ